MYPSKDARELAILLRISRELDIVGDISATVDNPSEVLAWATILTNPEIVAWRARDSGHRYLQVTANHERAPVRGRVTAVLPCEQHAEFWCALGLDELESGGREHLALTALSTAWASMPVTPADMGIDDAAAAVIAPTGTDEPAVEVDGT
jgi:hypothetical protein